MPTNGVPEYGGWRHPWPWFLGRGLLLFALGFGLAWVGSWLHALWLQVVAFGLALAGAWMHAIAFGEARRGRWSRYWKRFTEEYERNERRARGHEAPATPRSNPPAA